VIDVNKGAHRSCVERELCSFVNRPSEMIMSNHSIVCGEILLRVHIHITIRIISPKDHNATNGISDGDAITIRREDGI
jgi:hypothetical protein